MENRKTIVHFIANLTRGGAETMLVTVINKLDEYRHVLVTLSSEDYFGSELKNAKVLCLNQKSLFSLPLSIIKFKKIIANEKPDIVHSHLLWPTMIARLATKRSIPLVTTIHTSVATGLDYKKWYIRFLEKLTYKCRKSIIIAVSKVAYDEYFSILKLRPHKALVLHTFVDVNHYNTKKMKPLEITSSFKIAAVGSLSFQKNFSYLVEAFSKLENKNIELDIYGFGVLGQQLQKQIDESGAKVFLKGQVKNINDVLPEYDLYVMSSLYEGFSLSVLEAMAAELPLLLSDIPSFREQCEDCAIYFDLNKTDDFILKLQNMISNKELRVQLAEQAYQRVINNFTLDHHLKGLRKIYSDALSNSYDTEIR